MKGKKQILKIKNNQSFQLTPHSSKSKTHTNISRYQHQCDSLPYYFQVFQKHEGSRTDTDYSYSMVRIEA